MPNGIKYSFLLFLTALLCGSQFQLATYKIFLQTPENSAELYRNRDYLRKLSINSLILNDLSIQWNGSPEKIIAQRPTLRAFSKSAFSYFSLYIPLSLNEELPKWDSPDWDTALKNIKTLCAAAQQSGIRGIIINTDTGDLDRRTYRKNKLWDPEENDRYQDISDSFAEQIIYERGREIMQIIESVDPKMQVAIYPVGPAEPITQNYTYWPHFAKGMLSRDVTETLVTYLSRAVGLPLGKP